MNVGKHICAVSELVLGLSMDSVLHQHLESSVVTTTYFIMTIKLYAIQNGVFLTSLINVKLWYNKV